MKLTASWTEEFGSESCVFLFATQNVKVKIYKGIILPVVLYTYLLHGAEPFLSS